MAIMEYINDIKPEANLLPKNPLTKAKVRLQYMQGTKGIDNGR